VSGENQDHRSRGGDGIGNKIWGDEAEVQSSEIDD
jgi:hypothetical protein